MEQIHKSFGVVSRAEYLKKVIKSTAVMLILNVPWCTGLTMKIGWHFNVDHKAVVVSMLRGFPNNVTDTTFTCDVSYYYILIDV
jgi:hypothetical protein